MALWRTVEERWIVRFLFILTLAREFITFLFASSRISCNDTEAVVEFGRLSQLLPFSYACAVS